MKFIFPSFYPVLFTKNLLFCIKIKTWRNISSQRCSCCFWQAVRKWKEKTQKWKDIWLRLPIPTAAESTEITKKCGWWFWTTGKSASPIPKEKHTIPRRRQKRERYPGRPLKNWNLGWIRPASVSFRTKTMNLWKFWTDQPAGTMSATVTMILSASLPHWKWMKQIQRPAGSSGSIFMSSLRPEQFPIFQTDSFST